VFINANQEEAEVKQLDLFSGIDGFPLARSAIALQRVLYLDSVT
jgi:hypothetical protein